jgi:putative addiction module killer protein
MFSVLQTEEFEAWLDGLPDQKARVAVASRIVQMEGGLLGDVKTLGDKVSEARIHYGPGYRLYFTKRELTIIILLCGGEKRSQRRDMNKAKKLAAEL